MISKIDRRWTKFSNFKTTLPTITTTTTTTTSSSSSGELKNCNETITQELKGMKQDGNRDRQKNTQRDTQR